MKMSLGEFIQKMKDGWGFHDPHRVKDIGDALESHIAVTIPGM